tara:strand:- start:949 stop:1149 length:201 start_codon:yes stop_codon:yes gene_type:complete
MAKAKELSITLTTLEANEIMRMLDDHMESCFVFGIGIDLDNWESLDLIAHKILAFHKFKTWYVKNV